VFNRATITTVKYIFIALHVCYASIMCCVWHCNGSCHVHVFVVLRSVMQIALIALIALIAIIAIVRSAATATVNYRLTF